MHQGPYFSPSGSLHSDNMQKAFSELVQNFPYYDDVIISGTGMTPAWISLRSRILTRYLP